MNRSRSEWFCVGKASTLPDLAPEGGGDCWAHVQHKCKVFRAPGTGSPRPEGQFLAAADADEPAELKDQVLVFAYKGRIHAMDHRCPHSSYPLSRATVFDIEDFGVVLSAGLTCPKHDWSFDLFSGRADRGNYRLKLWDVELRGDDGADKDVWVRRRPSRIG